MFDIFSAPAVCIALIKMQNQNTDVLELKKNRKVKFVSTFVAKANWAESANTIP
jgi:hypothetical protein